jgi:hypothetical protein
MLRQYRDDQKPRATDLNEQLVPILEHNQYKLGKFEMIKYEYIYKEEHLKYIFEQQHEVQLANNDLDMYADLSVHEFSQFKQHIGNPRVVFEAGCGIGRGSVYLNHLLQDDEIEYIDGNNENYISSSGDFPKFKVTDEIPQKFSSAFSITLNDITLNNAVEFKFSINNIQKYF